MTARPPHIVIAGDAFGFPVGSGAATRAKSYALGLRRHGALVTVLVTTPSEPRGVPPINTEVKGVYDEILFEYSCGMTQRPVDFLGRARLRASLHRRYATALLRANARCPIQAVVLFSNTPSIMVTTWATCRVLGCRYVLEKSEIPFAYAPPGKPSPLYRAAYVRMVYRLPEKILVISDDLAAVLRRYASPKTQLVYIPPLVDVGAFDGPAGAPPAATPVVSYFGELRKDKGIEDLVDAFAKVSVDHPGAVLRLGGFCHSQAYLEGLLRQCRDRGVLDHVDYLGAVSDSDYRLNLSFSTVLVVPHPLTSATRAARSTKLAEYLASGRPVVVTRVGGVEPMLRDGETAILTNAQDPSSLARGISRALADPVRANLIGAAGRELARTRFGLTLHTRRLLGELLRSDGE